MIKRIIKKITPEFVLKTYHYCWAFFSALFYFFPSGKMIIIGITGTNGKSTTVDMVSKMLIAAGYKTASISSLRFQMNEKVWQNRLKMTMPGRFAIQKFLHQAFKEDCKYVVLETTSEGIKQYRHKFIDYDVAVITNLKPEHIEAHGSFEKYMLAKGKLFEALSRDKRKKNIRKISIVNLDDENAKYFLNFKSDEKWGYGLKDSSIEVNQKLIASNINTAYPQTKFSLNNEEITINFLGEFNILNSLAAISICLSQKISLDLIIKSLEDIHGVPGRMEVVSKKPLVFVDFAHTPDALEAIHKAIKPLKKGDIICVLGSCGGGRDKWKRPEMGKISDQNCDKIILTNEDPYDENPELILDQIGKGIIRKKAERILDRKEAIKRALQIAQNEDIVLITGKGSEPLMCLANGQKIPWDDREIVRQELNKIHENKGNI
ncbi:MAG: UDP-N-acetylmuramoyl-L-alanyl-D-glutamate--2,6-diaminopimelate ligase [Candidatus Paceibacterota bacterium]|jgi:UDP-N-acetylmuramoyl-L-alanyl-D-glutamate--2,6-diaminopimelate ligase